MNEQRVGCGSSCGETQRGFRAMVEIEAETLLAQTGFVGYPAVMLIGFPAAGGVERRDLHRA